VNVLSLFDGMSCGQIALNRIGIKPDKYYASELDKYAIKVTQANYSDTIQLGDVTKWREWDIDWASIDLLIGGSPCQGFSFAGKQLAFDDPRSKLFFVYVDILNHIKSVNPSVNFMLENVKMKKEFLAVISEHLGVEPVFINSALVSAQNRQRYYWCNWFVEQPRDKGICIKDIIDSDISFDDVLINQRPRGNNPGGLRGLEGKSPCLSSSGWEYNHELVFLMNPKTDGRRTYQQDRIYDITGKFPALTACLGCRFNVGKWHEGAVLSRRFTINELEKLQTLPIGYTAHVTNTQRSKMIGNGWTVDVIKHLFASAFKKEPQASNIKQLSLSLECA
tara:strand:- start:2292 stop:3296 length:1005 start_codon:yes stop_codon:yes gene_type:complete